MKTTINSLLLRVSALASLALVLVSAPSANAVMFTVSGTSVYPTSTKLYTQNNPSLASFNFSGLSGFNSLSALRGLAFNVTFDGLDTMVGNADYNNISLLLNGYDTGLKLNGFSNDEDSKLVILNNVINNDAAILNAFTTTGILTASIFDATGGMAPGALGSNPFWYGGSTISLTISDQPVPFTPTQSLGLGLMALLLGVRKFPSLRRFMFARA